MSTSMRSWSPGFTGRRNFTLSIDMKYTTFEPGSSTVPIRRTPPTCAIASTISTPGMMGCPGKCPWKKGSLIVTFLIPTTRVFSSISTIRSTNRNGYRWGRICMISSMPSTRASVGAAGADACATMARTSVTVPR